MVVGNGIIGGRLADIALIPSIFGIIAWNIVFLGLFSLSGTLQTPVLIVLFMLGCGFSLVPALQAHMMNIAGEAQTLASSLTHSAFNISMRSAQPGELVIASGGKLDLYGVGWVCFPC